MSVYNSEKKIKSFMLYFVTKTHKTLVLFDDTILQNSTQVIDKTTYTSGAMTSKFGRKGLGRFDSRAERPPDTLPPIKFLHYCEDRFHIHIFNRSSHICWYMVFHIFTVMLRTNTSIKSMTNELYMKLNSLLYYVVALKNHW